MAKDSGALNLFGNMQKPTKDKTDKTKKENSVEVKTEEIKPAKKEEVVVTEVIEEEKETEIVSKPAKSNVSKKSEIKKKAAEPKKLGRPKTLEEDKIRLTVYLTPEVKEKVSKYSTMFPGGVSGYIEKAIKKDLELNEANYEQIIKNIMG